MIHCSVSRISLLRRCDDWMDGKNCHWFVLPERNVFVLHFMGVFIYEAGGHSNPIADVSGHFEKKNAGSWTKRWTTTTEATKHIATVHSSVFLHLMWCMISFINSTFISRVSIFNFKYTGFLGLSRGPNFWQPQILDTATSGSCGSQHLFFWGSSPSGLCHLIVGARCRVVFFLWVDGVRWQGWH